MSLFCATMPCARKPAAAPTVAPGATAQLLTDRLRSMLLVAALVAALSAIVGYIFALIFDTSVAGMIASAALVIFIAAALLAPRHGFFPRRTRQLRLSLRIVQEAVSYTHLTLPTNREV